MISFVESGMTFTFDDGNCYRIEKDPLMHVCCHGSTQNNMTCECVSVINGHHYFIEAKQSAPNKSAGSIHDLRLNGRPLPANWVAYDNYHKYLRDITKKFVDSASLLKALFEGRHGVRRKTDLPLPLKKLNFDRVRFILIINPQKDYPEAYYRRNIIPLMDSLKSEMKPFLNTWNIPDKSVKILLPSQARELYGIDVVTNPQKHNPPKGHFSKHRSR